MGSGINGVSVVELIRNSFCVRKGVGAESALCVKGELLFAPFYGVRPPENGTIATGVLLLRLTALRELHGWARTDGPRAFLSPIRALPLPRWGNPQRLAWKKDQPGLCFDRMRPANCISPEDEDRDTLLACAVLPDPSLSRFPASRAWLRAPLSYARVSSAFARARCHAAGVSSSRGINPSTQGRVARYDSCGNTSNR